MKTIPFILKVGFLIVLIVEVQLGFASHYSGITIRHEFINTCLLRVYVTDYRDCNTYPGNPNTPVNPYLSIDCLDGNCNLNAVNTWTLESINEVTNSCPFLPSICNPSGTPGIGMIAVTQYQDYNICGQVCDSFVFSFTNCCRNYGNVNGGAGTSISITDTVILSLSTLNNSPIQISPLKNYICAGDTSYLNFAAIDPDGDSLSYNLVPCWENAIPILTPIPYNPGFTYINPLGASWNIDLDSITGKMTLLPIPGNILTAAIAIQVSEWRNISGTMTRIGSTSTDFLIISENCSMGIGTIPPSPVAPLSVTGGGVNGNYFTLFTDIPFSATFSVTPLLGQTITVDTFATLYQLPNASITVSNTNPVNITVNWTPTMADTGFHGLAITVNDGNCPIPSSNFLNNILEVKDYGIISNITHTACGDTTGAIDITVMGNVIPPFSYSWSTGDTTEDIQNISSGIYSVIVTDSLGVLITSAPFYVLGTNLFVNLTGIPPDCSNTNGIIQTFVTGGFPPYTYTWNVGSNSQNLNNIPAGGYSVYLTDTTGCLGHDALLLPLADSCYNLVSGRVYWDSNLNCIYDTSDYPLSYVPIQITINNNTNVILWTDSVGNYTYIDLALGNYTINAIGAYLSNNQSNCLPNASYNIYFNNIGNASIGLDFPYQYLSGNFYELEVNLFEGQLIPNHSQSVSINYKNNGNMTPIGNIYYYYSIYTDDNIYTNPPYNSIDTVNNIIVWSNLNLQPFTNSTIHFSSHTSASSINYLGSQSVSKVEITPTDIIPTNNKDTTNQIVLLLPFDPNFKEVSPKGIGNLGTMPITDSIHRYTVHFQNTGTAPAIYVIIRDTIDSDLDILSYEPTTSSHPYTLSATQDSILIFTFANIMLPDSGTDFLGSQGHVGFKMKHKTNSQVGTQIKNSASIYFDFNAPVLTNEVVNTLHAAPILNLTPNQYICKNDTIYGNTNAPIFGPYTITSSNGFSQNSLDGILAYPATDTGWQTIVIQDMYGFADTSQIYISFISEPNAEFTYSQVGNVINFMPVNAPVNAAFLWNIFGIGTYTIANPSVTFPASGNYIVTLNTTNDCGGIDTVMKILSVTVGIENDLFIENVKLYPNPSAAYSILSFPNPNQDKYTLTVIDASGKEVRRYENITSEKIEMSKEGLSEGVYLLRLKGKHSFEGKWIVGGR